MLSDMARYVEVGDNLEEHGGVNVQDQAITVARLMEELRAQASMKIDCPTQMY